MKKFINDIPCISSSAASSIALSICAAVWGNDVHSAISNKESDRHPICEINKLWMLNHVCSNSVIRKTELTFSKKGVLSTFYLVEDKEVEQLFCCDFDSN